MLSEDDDDDQEEVNDDDVVSKSDDEADEDDDLSGLSGVLDDLENSSDDEDDRAQKKQRKDSLAVEEVKETQGRDNDLSSEDFRSDMLNDDDDDGLSDICDELTKENGSHSKHTESEIDNEPAPLV